MDIISNIEKYKRVFSRLSKNSKIMFKDYLKSNNITELEFLYQIGLNPNLITEANYEEINGLITANLSQGAFPSITSSFDKESGLICDTTIYNSETNNAQISVSNNALKVQLYNEDNDINLSNYYYFTTNNNIINVVFNVIIKKDITNNQIIGYSISAKQKEYDLNSKAMNEFDYNLTLNYNHNRIKELVMRYITSNSIFPLLANLNECIQKGIINKEDIILSTSGNLKK